jgi:hypothetical protein
MEEGKGIGDRNNLMPRTVYCCAHNGSCAVHQPPHDGAYVHCTCDQGAGRYRHKRFTPDPHLVRGTSRVQ